MAEKQANKGEPVRLGQLLGRLSHQLHAGRIGAGSLAELRRMTRSDRPPDFWRLYLQIVPEAWREPGGRQDARVDDAWAAVIQGMAEMAPDALAFGRPFGTELSRAGYSESRFVRLLRAENADLAREFRVAAGWLGSKGVKANLTPVAELLLGRPYVGLNVGPEYVARTLAHDFFRAEAARS